MTSKRFRIFVASPCDVVAERDAIDCLAHEICAEHEGAVELEVLRWERLTDPCAGRPQENLLNKVASFDILVAVFWTRCGSTTGYDSNGIEVAESGSIEELQQAFQWVDQKIIPCNHVLIYQCTRELPFDVDLDQVKRVRALFDWIRTDRKALVAQYKVVEEFREQLKTHLANILDRSLANTEPPAQSRREREQVQIVYGTCPISVTHRLERREKLLDRMAEQLNAPLDLYQKRACVLYGPSGAGKSVLAACYFDESSEAKRWVICRSTLAPFVQHLSLDDASLVVLDGFEDKEFCWQALEIASSGARVLVTCENRALAERILRKIGCRLESCMIEVGGLDINEWNERLGAAVGKVWKIPFERFAARLQRLPAGLQLLCSVLDADDIPDKQLFAIDKELEEQSVLISAPGNEDEARRQAPRWDPAPYLAGKWWQKHHDDGDALRVLSTIPLLGMSTLSLAQVLDKDLCSVEATIRSLAKNSFVWPLNLGAETIWIPLDYYRDAFERTEVSLAVEKKESVWRERYLKYCWSGMSKGVLTKLDASFVSVSGAFRSGAYREVMAALRRCLYSVTQVRNAQQLAPLHWVTISEALVRRARTCSHEISIAQTLSFMEAHSKLGDLAWSLRKSDDSWAESCAIYASVKHWFFVPGDRSEYVERLVDHLQRLLDSDAWFSTNGKSRFLEMVPAILLGGIGILGSFQRAVDEMQTARFSRRFARSAYLHIVPIFQALDYGRSGAAEVLAKQYWPRIQGGPCKNFASAYLKSVLPSFALEDEGGHWRFRGDPRIALAQAAFSRGALNYALERVMVPNKRFEGASYLNILGADDWFPEPQRGAADMLYA